MKTGSQKYLSRTSNQLSASAGFTESQQVTGSAIILLIAALLAYGNSLQGPFIFDDVSSIVENPTIRHLRFLGDVLSPPSGGGATVGGRPILNFSLACNYAISGLEVWSYHAANLLIHYLAGLCLFGLVRRSLVLSDKNLTHQSTQAVDLHKNAVLVALFTSAMWLVHPLQTESVTYVVQRAESLMGLFFLLTLYAFARAVTSSNPRRWWIISFLACLLGAGTKEIAALAPIMVFLYDRVFVSGSFKEAWRKHRWFHLSLAATWLPLGWLLAGTGGNRGGTIGFDIGVSWYDYWLTQLEAIVRYLGLSFWPHPLVFDYGQTFARNFDAVLPWAILFVAVITFALLIAWRRPRICFLVLWIFILLAPTSLVPGSSQMIVEHRMYLSLAAVVILVFTAMMKWCGARTVTFVGSIALIAAMITTHQRNADYSTPEKIWADTVSKHPKNARAHNNLALIIYQQGRVEEAIVHYRESIRLNPTVAQAHYNLGLALMDLGKFAESIDLFSQAIQLLPYYYDAHLNLGRALAQTGRTSEALLHFEEAIRFDPSPGEPHFQLGVALASLGRWSEACEHYSTAVTINPANAETHSNWGVALFQMNLPEAAIEHFRLALELKPNLADVHFNLGLALNSLGRTKEALTHFDATLKLKPGFSPAEEMSRRLRADLAR